MIAQGRVAAGEKGVRGLVCIIGGREGYRRDCGKGLFKQEVMEGHHPFRQKEDLGILQISNTCL